MVKVYDSFLQGVESKGAEPAIRLSTIGAVRF